MLLVKKGLGKQLIRKAENWAKDRGCKEMASDCYCDNDVSKSAHIALGYEKKKCLVHFAKRI